MSASAQEGNGTHQLQAILPDWCALSWQHALICFTFLVLFLHFCYLPLPSGQIWHEVANGSTIVNSGFAAADPALPYSDGVRALKTNWLGQALVYWTHNFGGPEWLSCMFALVQIATLAIWAFLFHRVSGRRWAAFLVAPIVLASSIDVNALGSSTFALLVFSLTALTILGTKTLKQSESQASEILWSNASIWRWLAVIGLFVLWANLDVSVLFGVGLLGVLAISRFVKILFRLNRNGSGNDSIMSDRELHHRTWLFEICLIATLLQPSGLGFWQAIFWSSNNPIVHGLGGWSPVAIASYRGLWIAIAWLGWIVASRRTTSIPFWNVAAAILVTAIVACFETQIVWFATTMCVLAVALLPQLPQRTTISTAAAKQTGSQANPNDNSNPSLKFAFTLVCGLLVWMAFSLSPIGTMAMSGKPRSTAQLFGSNTPLGATQFLQENRPAKVVWTPKYWADHLQVAGEPTLVLANLNDALLTPRIEKDYQSIYYGGRNWKRLLRRYQIDDLVVDKENQTELMRQLSQDTGKLEKVFEDQISVIYRRTANSKVQSKSKTAARSKRNQEISRSQQVKTNSNSNPTSIQKTEQFDWQGDNETPQFNNAAFEKTTETRGSFKTQLQRSHVRQNVEKRGAFPRSGELGNGFETTSSPQKGSGTRDGGARPKRQIKAQPASSKPTAASLFGDDTKRTKSIFGD